MLRIVWLLGLSAWLLFASPALADDAQILHVVNRLSYGVAPGDLARVKAMGIDRYLQEQLNPDQIPENQLVSDQLRGLASLTQTPQQLFASTQPNRINGQRPTPEQLAISRERSRQILQEAIQAKLTRSVLSKRQLFEVMTDFWFNHFNVFSNKGLTQIWVGSYEQDAIRPYALGKFRQLLGATAKHPAMLFYLDNWQNTAPNSPGARGIFRGLNENYARELMELHTLGVNGGYTQQDVISLARILTGWGFQQPGRTGDNYGFAFDPRRHDRADKVFLGQPILGGGIEEGERALDILARHPSTAKHISFKLAQYFVADEPPPALVDRLAQRFLASDGDIKAVLMTLFASPEFRGSQYHQAKFKSPYRYVISALRANQINPTNWRPVAGLLFRLAMPVYGCPTPDGYKNTETAWLNPEALTQRLNFAVGLNSFGFGVRRGQPLDAGQLMTALGDRFSASTKAAVEASPPQLRSALLLGSREFMYY